jgi:hypothetical protein
MKIAQTSPTPAGTLTLQGEEEVRRKLKGHYYVPVLWPDGRGKIGLLFMALAGNEESLSPVLGDLLGLPQLHFTILIYLELELRSAFIMLKEFSWQGIVRDFHISSADRALEDGHSPNT